MVSSVLIAVMLAAASALLILAGRQAVHRRRLSRKAHELGLSFSPADPFRLPRRYGAFELMQTGHSRWVNHVVYGRIRGWFLRGFDYRCEVGHGPGRMVRRFMVVGADTHLHLPRMQLWRGENARVSLLPTAGQDLGGAWQGTGPAGDLQRIVQTWPGPAEEAVCIEAEGGLVLISQPGRLDAKLLVAAAQWLDRLAENESIPPADQPLQPA